MNSVSVVIAAWNAAGFITRALQCALDQTGVEVEVVVVDDCSTDDTEGVVRSFADPRVRYARLDRNAGPAAARNRGFGLARHDWIAVLDADDAMASDRLARLTSAAQAAGADIIADNFWIEAPGKPDRLFIDEPLDGATLPIDLAEYCRQNLLFRTPKPLGYLKPLFSRAFLVRHLLSYDADLRIGEDCQLVIEALLKRARYVRHRSAGYIYQTREGSISHRLASAQARAMAKALRRAVEPYSGRLSMEEFSACRRMLASLETGAAFVETVERLKRGDVVGAAGLCLKQPGLIAHFSMPIQARLGALMPALSQKSFR